MDAPPRISEAPAKEVPIEVLPPETSTAASPKIEVEAPPIHALSALVLVAVDNLWNLAEWAVVDWVFTIPLSFITVFVPVFLLQKHLKKDSNGRALAFATLLAMLAAIPTSITGTPVGLGLLAWTGLRKLVGKQTPTQDRH
jgi:hypothetical protein